MIKDLPENKVEDIAIAVALEKESVESKIWYVYLINLKKEAIENVLITSKGYGEKDGEQVNGKSIMGLMMLAAGPGSKVIVKAEGHDALAALAELETLLNRKFDEE